MPNKASRWQDVCDKKEIKFGFTPTPMILEIYSFLYLLHISLHVSPSNLPSKHSIKICFGLAFLSSRYLLSFTWAKQSDWAGCDVIGSIYVFIKSRGLKLKFMRVPHFEEKRVVGRIRRKDVSVGHNRS